MTGITITGQVDESTRDELELALEEIADLELSHDLADDVRGASGGQKSCPRIGWGVGR